MAMPSPFATSKPKALSSVSVKPSPAPTVIVTVESVPAAPVHSDSPETGAGQSPAPAGDVANNIAPSVTIEAVAIRGANETIPHALFRSRPPFINVCGNLPIFATSTRIVHFDA